MATEAEKLAEAMATAMGVKLVTENPEDNTIIENTETNPDGTPKTEGSSEDGNNDGGLKDGNVSADGKSANTGKKLPTDPVTTDFDKLLHEKSNGRFKTLDDIDKALKTTIAESFANDEVVKINEYVKSGGNLDDFIKTQRTDYSKISDLDALREAERLADPTLSSADIELLLEDKYGFAENATDKEKRLKEIQIKRDGNVAKQSLIENQKKWAVVGKSKEDIAAEGLKWKATLHETADKVEKLDIKLSETDTFTYAVPAETRGKVKTDNETLSNFFGRYVNADGSENVEKFVKDMIILDNFENIVKAAAGFNKSKGKEEIIKEIKQTNFQAKGQTTGSATPKTIAQQVAEQIFKK